MSELKEVENFLNTREIKISKKVVINVSYLQLPCQHKRQSGVTSSIFQIADKVWHILNSR